MTGKKFVFITLFGTIFCLLLLSVLVYIVDPYFHYHKPFKNITYVLNNQRYQNDGIVKHFDYDAIVAGTSMTENFKTSEVDKLFGVNTVKVSFSGANFKEVNDNLEAALKSNNDIKLVIRCLDLYKLNLPKDKSFYDLDTYPTYLYDDNVINDVKYLLNKSVMVTSAEMVNKSLKHEKSTSFDDYGAWYKIYTFSKATVDSTYNRPIKYSMATMTDSEYEIVKDNIKQNITDLTDKYPNTEFYVFYPPYSIYYFDEANQIGRLSKEFDAIEYSTELLLEHKNIHLYSFLDEYDIITNLDNYKDIRHYSESINSLILNRMKDDKNVITKDNYKKKMNEMKKFYLNYDYDKLFN